MRISAVKCTVFVNRRKDLDITHSSEILLCLDDIFEALLSPCKGVFIECICKRVLFQSMYLPAISKISSYETSLMTASMHEKVVLFVPVLQLVHEKWGNLPRAFRRASADINNMRTEIPISRRRFGSRLSTYWISFTLVNLQDILRPEFLRVKTKQYNPVTEQEEPYLSRNKKFANICAGGVTVVFFVSLNLNLETYGITAVCFLTLHIYGNSLGRDICQTKALLNNTNYAQIEARRNMVRRWKMFLQFQDDCQYN